MQIISFQGSENASNALIVSKRDPFSVFASNMSLL